MMTRPEMPKEKLLAILAEHGASNGVALVGIRGFFSEKNQRGIYDDAIFLVTSSEVIGYNANTDPSTYGANAKIMKGMASLQPGTWHYKIGLHGINKKKVGYPYKALVQAAPVTIKRDDGPIETGYFGINIHRGSLKSTSSEGCQTIYPDQFPPFIDTVQNYMDKDHQTTIPYCLI